MKKKYQPEINVCEGYNEYNKKGEDKNTFLLNTAL